ncbi:MAG: leucyl aminopeptidase family protein [Deltaproteobacteria bacterium]|nr:leucyl aminopeptidase family protein [Deltaproteobacteria bacterium]
MALLDLTFDLNDLLADAQTMVVIGRRSDLVEGWPQAGLPSELRDVVARMAADAKPAMGASSSTLLPIAAGLPKNLVLIALHDSLARHLSDARALDIYLALRNVARPDGGKVAILCALRDASQALGAVLGIARAYPLYSRKSSAKGDPKAADVKLLLTTKQGALKTGLDQLAHARDAVHAAQRWVDMPTAELDTAVFESEAKALAATLPHTSIQSLVGDELLTHGLRGLHAVGRTAMVAPRLVILDYNPPSAQGEPVALIGKGLVYDTGGLFLKIADSRMLTMKCDMGGGAAVLGALAILAHSGLARRVICAVAMAENAIGPDSYRPDDIIEMHSGKTMEVNNTDAEGRIAVADAASYVARNFKPTVLIDAATLTGAQLMATGKYHAGIVANDGALEQTLIDAGLTSGDHCMPLLYSPELHTTEFKSTVADMRNSVADRMNAASSASGLWIYMHIDDLGLKWAHVDLAGPAFLDNRGTGYGVGLLAEAVRNLK